MIGTDRDPADLPVAIDNERRRAGDIVGVVAESVINAVGSRNLAGFVEQNGKGIFLIPDVLLCLEEAVDFLCGDENNGGIPFREFSVR